MSDEHTSLMGSAYNDGYDEGYRDGLAGALKEVRLGPDELNEWADRIWAAVEYHGNGSKIVQALVDSLGEKSE